MCFLYVVAQWVRSLARFSGAPTRTTKSQAKNNPALWGGFSDGDTTLDYLFSLFNDQSMILDLIDTEVGEAGAEGDASVTDGQSTRQTP